MEVKISSKNSSNGYKFSNTVTIKSNPSVIKQILSVFDGYRENEWCSISDYLINETNIYPLGYYQGSYDIYDEMDAERLAGQILSYGLLSDNTIEVVIESDSKYRECDIKYFFLSNIIETEEDRIKKIKEIESEIAIKKEEISVLEKKLKELK